MKLWTCIRAFGELRPGDQAEMPDDAELSRLHWADSLEDPEAHPAVAARRAEDAAAEAARDVVSPPADPAVPSPVPAADSQGAASVAAPAATSAESPSGGN